nr:hypothetical protein [Pandoravirus massiliensis]
MEPHYDSSCGFRPVCLLFVVFPFAKHLQDAGNGIASHQQRAWTLGQERVTREKGTQTKCGQCQEVGVTITPSAALLIIGKVHKGRKKDLAFLFPFFFFLYIYYTQ